jgi:hypothetical protein
MKRVQKLQKVVAQLRNRYNKLVEEKKELDMELVETKLVAQLIKPHEKKDDIKALKAEKAAIEENRQKMKIKPDADNQGKLAQHQNLLKKHANELSGYRKLNSIKTKELK